MRVADEWTWEAEYWDDYIAEFGVAAYVEARYLEWVPLEGSATESVTQSCGRTDRATTSSNGGSLGSDVGGTQ